MNILVLNCGSSSLKYQLINMDDESVLAKGLVERIGIEGSILTHKPTGKDKYVVEQPMKDHNIVLIYPILSFLREFFVSLANCKLIPNPHP